MLSTIELSINKSVLLAKSQAPKLLSKEAEKDLIKKIKQRLIEQNAVLVAHYYVDEKLQYLAEQTGGLVSDSLDMAAFGQNYKASTLVVCGVNFMGETAKILSPNKRVLMPNLKAECSLDLACPADEFLAFRKQHPDRTAVVYANTSAAVKGITDWVVTSSNALDIIKHLHSKGEKILWAPDRHLGNWIQSHTDADILNWDGHCVVHDEFRIQGLEKLLQQHPEAVLIAHPESPTEILDRAQVVGSTKKLVDTVNKMDANKFIVATDEGIFYKMLSLQPKKEFFLAPTGGKGATCVSCGHCPWMALNSLQSLYDTLGSDTNEIKLSMAVINKAKKSINRMMEFSQQRNLISGGDA